MMANTPTTNEQLVAWTLAHRVLLAYLVKIAAKAIPEEGSPDMREATVTMLHNSIPQFVAKLDQETGERLTALAQQEIDRIFVAPLLPAP